MLKVTSFSQPTSNHHLIQNDLCISNNCEDPMLNYCNYI